MTHIPDSPDPFDPLGSTDPLLQHVREALQRHEARVARQSLVEAQDDLQTRLHAQLQVAARPAPPSANRTADGTSVPPSRATQISGLSRLRQSWPTRLRVASGTWIAAGLAIAIVTGVTLIAWRTRTALSRATTYRTYATGNGQIANLTLDDGSHVALAPNTTLSVSHTFAARRELAVRGEAYFDVASRDTPFLVHAGGVMVRVLGTRFDLRRYDSDTGVRVAVVAGKVSVTGRRTVTLTAGEIGHVTDSSTATKAAGDATTASGWVAGTMAFREVPASELLDAVAHWYGLEFHLTDSTLARRPVVATLVRGETRADALELVSKLLSATMTFTDTDRGVTIVTLHPTRADRPAPSSTRHRRDPFPSHVPEVGR